MGVSCAPKIFAPEPQGFSPADFLAPGEIGFKWLNSRKSTMTGTTSKNRGLQMATKSNSNSRGWGGSRTGAGRPPGNADDRRAIAIEIALGGLERALKAYRDPADDDWSTLQHRWHLAMILLGVPTDTIAEALFKPEVSQKFSRDIAAALRAVEASGV